MWHSYLLLLLALLVLLSLVTYVILNNPLVYIFAVYVWLAAEQDGIVVVL